MIDPFGRTNSYLRVPVTKPGRAACMSMTGG